MLPVVNHPLTDEMIMAIATFLICTTFVTNVPDGSVVTRECRAEAPRIEVAEHSSLAKLPLRTINDVTITAQEHAAAAPAANPPPPSAAKPLGPQHAKRVVHMRWHRRHAGCCSVEVLPAADVAPKQVKRISFWDQLMMAHQRKMEQPLDR